MFKQSICLRCGKTGHAIEKCKSEIPSIVSMRNQLEKMEKEALTYSSQINWEKDELGLYEHADSRCTNVGKTWGDGDFCFNCGEFGHTAENCKEPTFDVINSMVAPIAKDSSAKGVEARKKIVDALYKYHESK